MKITSESVLVDRLAEKLKDKFKTDTSFREFSAGYGVADLVFAKSYTFTNNESNRRPISNYSTIQILNKLKKSKEYKMSAIFEMFSSISKPRLRRIFKDLVKWGYLSKNTSGNLVKEVSIKKINPIKKTIAIEAKLKDYRGGLIQAKRYLYFADESYLALPIEASKRIDKQLLDEENIGIIFYDPDKDNVIIKKPKKTIKSQKCTVQIYAKELMLNRYKKAKST